MTATVVDVNTGPDGTLVIRPHGVLGSADAGELRRALIEAIRHTRPQRLILDLADVVDLDPINLGTLAAACQLGDDHRVTVLFDHAAAGVADRLAAAGVPRHRLRRIVS
ncbi:STAS domain-containing protein [Actinoplanes sp. NPDC049596]|uniref:STAS domain-containing protein n=1 Tax=unclassified Actinoplanes TaxID=2626549 RepID=UPI003433647B